MAHTLHTDIIVESFYLSWPFYKQNIEKIFETSTILQLAVKITR